MYVPNHFTATDAELRELLEGLQAADLITPTTDGLYATFLPLIYDTSGGPHGTLLGHVARRNDHWQLEPTGESLVIVRGPDGYITPGWYASKAEHGRVVPTWNYTTVHVHGQLKIHDDRAWLEAFVRRLTDRHEAYREQPWKVDDAPSSYLDGQFKAIVGIELVITRVEAKAKLGQNRSSADIDGVISGLRERGRPEDALLADATVRARP
jgi:transcriptional regulator